MIIFSLILYFSNNSFNTYFFLFFFIFFYFFLIFTSSKIMSHYSIKVFETYYIIVLTKWKEKKNLKVKCNL